MTPVVLALDASTTAVKAITWDPQGNAVSEGRAALALANPAPDAYEQDAPDWWKASAMAIRAAMAPPFNRKVEAICIAHQRETFVITDDACRPLHPALVWMDNRATPAVERAVAELSAQRLHELSGKPPCNTPSLYKIKHLLETLAPDLAKPSIRVLDVHAYLVHALTGELRTSTASADPLGLVDMRTRRWSPELCRVAGVDPSRLPELVEPGEVIGHVSDAAARATGLTAGLPVIAGAGDGQAAGLGAGILAPGRAYLNLGTALVCGVLSRELRLGRAFRTLFGAAPGTYFLETDLKGGTFTFNWLAEHLLGSADGSTLLNQLAKEAASIPAGSNGLLLVPYLCGVMNPYWDDAARGVILGLSGHHGPAHIYRAILEGLALEQRLHLEGVEAATGPIEEVVLLGGPASSDLVAQVFADVLRRPLRRARTVEATALGAGVLAAAGVGLHPSLDLAARAMTESGPLIVPFVDRAVYDQLFEVYRGVYPALAGAMKQLAALR